MVLGPMEAGDLKSKKCSFPNNLPCVWKETTSNLLNVFYCWANTRKKNMFKHQSLNKSRLSSIYDTSTHIKYII